jgi:hypothetical protein
MSVRNSKVATPGRLDGPLVILRKVDVAPLSIRANRQAPTTMELIGQGYAEQGVEEKDLIWFRDGYILNDQPRTSIITDEIMAHTLGFAIARTDNGEIVREGGPDSLGAMIAAVAGARIELSVGVELADDDMPDDFDPDVDPATAEGDGADDSEASSQG